jgi:AbiV family abortive infection protein
MRARAIPDLANLSDEALFAEIAEGLAFVAENVLRIDADSKILFENKKGRGHRILTAFADEEAAKFLILLDAIRCPRSPQERFSRHLRKCYSHLAKGIYAQTCDRRPWSFADLKQWVERESHDYYLDGPNDVDWIVRNETIQSREDALYVDYIENDGMHFWTPPTIHDDLYTDLPPSRGAVNLALALRDTGCSKPEALKIIAHRWRPVEVAESFDVHSLRRISELILEDLSRSSLLIEQPDEVYSTIVERWTYPMYDLGLKELEVNKSDLERERESWSP